MTRIFNLHDDIGADLYMQETNGIPSDFKRTHMARLKQGGILYCSAACFFDGNENWQVMKDEIQLAGETIEKHAGLITSAKDLSEDNKEPLFLLSVEGMCGIDKHVNRRIRWMYEHGVRIESFTWNEFNNLATGIGGDPMRGLTKKGRRAVRKMNELGMIIDVSHANEHTFWDIINTTDKPIIASHSNAKALCNVSRNLTDEQIVAIAETGGIIGLNAVGKFISDIPEERDAVHLAKHARHITSIVGHEHLACGFDFCDYLDEYHANNDNKDLCCAPQAQNFIKALGREGFREEEIEDIAWRNAYRFLKEHL